MISRLIMKKTNNKTTHKPNTTTSHFQDDDDFAGLPDKISDEFLGDVVDLVPEKDIVPDRQRQGIGARWWRLGLPLALLRLLLLLFSFLFAG